MTDFYKPETYECFNYKSKEITVKELSQLYAMKPEAIVKKNNFSSIDQILPKGEKVYLR